VFEGWPKWERMLAANQKPEDVPTFQEFHDDEKDRREATWTAEQSTAPPPPADPSWRGWLEGKPDRSMPEDPWRSRDVPLSPALYARESKVSDEGPKLATYVPPGAPVGSKFPTPDPDLEPPPRRGSRTDRPAVYPSLDKGNTERIVRRVGR